MATMPINELASAPRSAECCTICEQRADVRLYFLTHGVAVPLCVVHRHGDYLRRDGGHVFCRELRASWRRQCGVVSANRERAVTVHPRRVQGEYVRDGEGSYAWVAVRVLAEALFAAGEPPCKVISDLRRRFQDQTATMAAARTMRRWFFEGRWLVATEQWRARIRQRNDRGRTCIAWRPERSALGMCLFHPGLALVLNVGIDDLTDELTEYTIRLVRQLIRLRDMARRRRLRTAAAKPHSFT